MFCKKCGAENEDNAATCTSCGESFQQVAKETPEPPGVKVPTRLVPAILVTLFCCLPLGIVAIVYAAKVSGKVQEGDIQGARDYSKKAAMWCWIGLGLGVVFTIIAALTGIIGGQ